MTTIAERRACRRAAAAAGRGRSARRAADRGTRGRTAAALDRGAAPPRRCPPRSTSAADRLEAHAQRGADVLLVVDDEHVQAMRARGREQPVRRMTDGPLGCPVAPNGPAASTTGPVVADSNLRAARSISFCNPRRAGAGRRAGARRHESASHQITYDGGHDLERRRTRRTTSSRSSSAATAAASSSTSASPPASARPTRCSRRRTRCTGAASTSCSASSRPTGAPRPRR